MVKEKILPLLLGGISFIIFSVGIPVAQEKVDYWKKQQEIYGRNLLNTEFQKVLGNEAIDIYFAIDKIKQSNVLSNPEEIAVIDEVQNIYLDRARKSTANMLFLSTEPIDNDDPPSKDRYDEICRKVKTQPASLKKEFDLFFDDFNDKTKRKINFWKKSKAFAQTAAIGFYLIGLFVGIIAKKDPNSNLAKENRIIIDRVNKLLKKLSERK